MEKNNLNIRQRRFIDNLSEGMTQKKAYKDAGYEGKDDSLKANASRLITKDNLKAEIQKRLKGIDLINRLRLGHISEIALAKLAIILQDDDVDDKTKLDAIKDALDRAGLKPIEEHKIKVEEVGDLANAKRKLINELDILATKRRKRQDNK